MARNIDENIASRVAKIEKDLLAMKSSQPIGSDSVRVYETLTNFVWDYDHTFTAADDIGFGTYQGSHGFTVRFVARNQSAPFASIRFYAKVDDQTYNPLWSTGSLAPSVGPANATIRLYEDITTTGSLSDYALDNTVRWRFNTAANILGTHMQIKVVVTATDMGKLEIKEFNTIG